MKRKSFAMFVFCLVVTVFLGAFSAVPVYAANEKKEYNFVFIGKSMQFPFFLSMIEGAEAAAKLKPSPERQYQIYRSGGLLFR